MSARATRPVVVAHRAGNDPVAAAAATRDGADLIELDVHMWRGRLEVRHARRAGPLLWDRGGIARGRGTPSLARALAALGPDAGAMLDLKSGPSRMAEAAVACALEILGARPLVVSSRRHALLEPLAGRAGVCVVHSAARPRERAALARAGVGAACLRRDLLDARVAAELAEHARMLYCWPVETPADARRLVSWGVRGLIVDDPALVRLLASAPL